MLAQIFDLFEVQVHTRPHFVTYGSNLLLAGRFGIIERSLALVPSAHRSPSPSPPRRYGVEGLISEQSLAMSLEM